MRVHELRLLETEPFARGEEYGRALAEQVRANAARYLWAFGELGVAAETVRRVAEESFEALEAWAPTQADELRGLAAGSGASLADLAALTARTEVLAYAPHEALECSTVVRLDATGPSGVQTWDWHAELVPDAVLLSATVGDRQVRTFAETGMLGKIGTAGRLSLFLNILSHESDARGQGVPVHAVARRILEEADTVEQAVAIAESASLSASTVLTVLEAPSAAKPEGDAASIELSPAGVALVRAEGGLLAHTNHFLDPTLAAGDAASTQSTTDVRLAHLRAVGPGVVAARSATELAQAMCGDGGANAPVCMRPADSPYLADRWETLITIAMVPGTGELHWQTGTPAEVTDAEFRVFGG
ncbi:C45 family autoproteolytic acyltransferase/hydolase [Gulosibacter sp. ACHW.36C]|uniref:C45 family peptidase n=1 Tax=Gulosibacter sediminis TaxID=1729695 RepID=A0ABY4MWP6_9MICO|nr:C45 family peptidase [Gulosibacter sediminis]UQN14841.1 C45 family peptidase [Gulosibacter sediminis]